jgi:HlyD family secretion protein
MQVQVVRIGLESDRITEERKVFIKEDKPPAQVFLGEQVEFRIAVATLPRALMVPEIVVSGYNGREGTVWTIEDDKLRRRLVSIRHRSDDARLEIVGGLPDAARVVSRINPDLREGRAARVARSASASARP